MNRAQKNILIILMGMFLLFSVIWGIGSYTQQDMGWIGSIEDQNDRVGIMMLFLIVTVINFAGTLGAKDYRDFWDEFLGW